MLFSLRIIFFCIFRFCFNFSHLYFDYSFPNPFWRGFRKVVAWFQSYFIGTSASLNCKFGTWSICKIFFSQNCIKGILYTSSPTIYYRNSLSVTRNVLVLYLSLSKIWRYPCCFGTKLFRFNFYWKCVRFLMGFLWSLGYFKQFPAATMIIHVFKASSQKIFRFKNQFSANLMFEKSSIF